MHADTPIVFIHQGQSWYLDYTVRQARSVNPAVNAVTLLGDARLPELHSRLGDAFRQRYEHLNSNNEAFERFNFLRWFYLLEYMERTPLHTVLYLDSDVLLYSSMQELHTVYSLIMKEGGLMILEEQEFADFTWAVSGHTSYWTRGCLQAFCDFIIHSFRDDHFKKLYHQKWDWHQAMEIPGGICDMTALYLFWREHQNAITNLAVEVQQTVCDLSVNTGHNARQHQYTMEDGRKKLRFVDNHPVFFQTAPPHRQVTVHTLHFQGQAKQHIPTYFTGRKSLSIYRQELRKRVRSVAVLGARRAAQVTGHQQEMPPQG